MSAAIFDSLLAISDALERAGVPPLSPFWREQYRRLYTHLTARTMIAMVGRGGDKTRSSVMSGIADTLSSTANVPPGERHYFVHVTENRDEGAKTIAIYEQYLRVLCVPFERTGDTIQLTDLPRGIRVLACRVGAVSGFRCFGWTADECAKWDNDGADPSAEVIASIKAMTVTHPDAYGRVISSPVATVGTFYEMWAAGDTDDQIAAHAPSWIANPSITQEQTRKLERDPKKHAREYGGVPQEGHDEALFSPDLIDRAMRREPGHVRPVRGVTYIAAMDPSLGRNAWTFVIACVRVRSVDARQKASVVYHREWRATGTAPLDPAAVLEAIDPLARAYGVRSVLTDQFHAESLAAIASRLRLGFSIAIDKPTGAEKLTRYEGVAVRLLDDEIELPNDRAVRADLLAVRRRVTANGNAFTIHMATTSDGRHADYAPSVTLALSRIGRVTYAAVATREKLDGMLLHLARGGELDAAAEARVHDRAREKMISARAVTSNDDDWQQKERDDWTRFCARGGVRQ